MSIPGIVYVLVLIHSCTSDTSDTSCESITHIYSTQAACESALDGLDAYAPAACIELDHADPFNA